MRVGVERVHVGVERVRAGVEGRGMIGVRESLESYAWCRGWGIEGVREGVERVRAVSRVGVSRA